MQRFLHAAHAVWRVAVLAGLLACLVGASSPVQAQELDLAWATSAGGLRNDVGDRIAVDGAGNSYVIGRFQGTATFGKDEVHETVLIGGPNTVFVAKYDRSSRLLWARRVVGLIPRSEYPDVDIAIDGAGNSYITGEVSGTVTFGDREDYETTLTSVDRALFVAKYDGEGRLRWVRQDGSGSRRGDKTNGERIAVDGVGNSYVLGGIAGTVTFGAGTVQETTLTGVSSRFNPDLFVAKYDGDGRLCWVRQVGGSDWAVTFTLQHRSIAVDQAGNSYITGAVPGTLTFKGGDHDVTLRSSSGQMFVVKYDRDGRLRWARRVSGNAYGRIITVDGAGNSYVTGEFGGTVTFGAGEARETTLTSLGTTSSNGLMFVAKYDGNGRLRWARRDGRNSGIFRRSLSMGVDRMGDLYVIGGFRGSVTFGMGEAHETALHMNSVDGTDVLDIFVAKYDASGQFHWARQAGGAGYKGVSGAAVDGDGQSYVTGSFFHPIVIFGNDHTYHHTLVNSNPTAFPGADIFVAKFLGELDETPPEEPHEAPPEEPYEVPPVVLANTAVTLDRPGPSAGVIWSNGTLKFQPGLADSPSVFTGDLTAVQTLTLHPGNTIVGTATAGGRVDLRPGATVTDEVVANAPVTPLPLPQPTFTANGPDHVVPPRGTLALAPGTYGAVTVGRDGTLQLHTGTYFLRTLVLEQRAKLVIDVATGPVRLNVVEQLTIGKQAQVTLTPDYADSALLTLTTLQTARLSIRAEAQVAGTLLVPYAQVRLEPQSQFTGALIADKVTVQRGAMLQPHSAVERLP